MQQQYARNAKSVSETGGQNAQDPEYQVPEYQVRHPGRAELLTVVLVFLAGLGAGVLAFAPGARGWFANEKAYELALQFLLIAVLGGGVAWAYRYAENRRAERLKDQERRRAEQERNRDQEKAHRAAVLLALQEMHSDFMAVYHKGKKIRRTLRAKSFPSGGTKTHSTTKRYFEALMDEMEDVQLRIEALAEEIDFRDDLFSDLRQKEDLVVHIRTTEKYLRGILRYYENNYANWRDISPDDAVDLSNDLGDFAGVKDNKQRVRNEFYEPARQARKIIIGRLKAVTQVSPAVRLD